MEAAQSLNEALPLLRRPFTPQAIRFKPQTERMAICYIDARLVIERLNLVCGGNWSDAYQVALNSDPRALQCQLTLFDTMRTDVGIAESSAAGGPKAIYSDALKRAAVKFGIGVSLYATPRMRLIDDDFWKKADGKKGGLTDPAIEKLRSGYTVWLNQTGVAMFGEPIDHGDAADAVGDYEVDYDTGVVERRTPEAPRPVSGRSPDAPTSTSAVINPDQIRKLWAQAKAAGLSEGDVHEMLGIMLNIDSVKEIPKVAFDAVLQKLVPFRQWKDSQEEAQLGLPDTPPSEEPTP